MNVTDEIIGDIKEQKAGLVYLGNNIDGKKFEEIRVMVIGDSNVGKTSFITQFLENPEVIAETSPTTSATANTIYLEFDRRNIALKIWDTPGREENHKLASLYYRCHGILIMYDITSKDTFQNVSQTWIPYFDNCGGSTAAKVLVGNKSDRDYSREVPFDEGQVLSEELVIPFFESSVEDKVNIEEAMVALLKLSMEKADLQPEKKCTLS